MDFLQTPSASARFDAVDARFVQQNAELRAHTDAAVAQLKTHTLMLHEQIIERLRLLDEGRSIRRKKR